MVRKFAWAIAVSSLFVGTVIATVVSAASPATLVKKPQQGQSTAKPTIEDNDFKFELQGCQRKSDKVLCTLLITNTADVDRKMWLDSGYSGSRYSRIIDVAGNEYRATSSQLGQAQGGTYAEVVLIQGIPMKGILAIPDVPRQVSELAVLEVGYGFYNNGQNQRSVQFRNLSMTGSK